MKHLCIALTTIALGLLALAGGHAAGYFDGDHAQQNTASWTDEAKPASWTD